MACVSRLWARLQVMAFVGWLKTNYFCNIYGISDTILILVMLEKIWYFIGFIPLGILALTLSDYNHLGENKLLLECNWHVKREPDLARDPICCHICVVLEAWNVNSGFCYDIPHYSILALTTPGTHSGTWLPSPRIFPLLSSRRNAVWVADDQLQGRFTCRDKGYPRGQRIDFTGPFERGAKK